MLKLIYNNKIFYLQVILLSSLYLFPGSEAKAQLINKVLFLGNSYTAVNNLPQIVHDVALSAGDTLIFDSNAPGGYQLIDHSLDVTSQNKIMNGPWDYVVLQGQSQEPVTYTSQFRQGGAALLQRIKQYNPCAVTMPYMTWGRKNGDASNCSNFPVMCTYQGMDSALRNTYLDFTKSINGEVSPVSVVWNYLRQNYPNINLYQADESHPSSEGSYAAACCFYASIFKKDPTLITYNFGLNAIDADIIKNVVKTVVFDSLQIWNFKKQPTSDFIYSIGSGLNEVIFSPISHGVLQNYFWDFGDGDTSHQAYTTHSYGASGTYTVTLTTTTCDLQGLHTSSTDTIIQFCNHTPTIYTSHPWMCDKDTLWTQPASSYQWLFNGSLIPETNQYLANHISYGPSGFSVISTNNGCSELSHQSTNTTVWSGFYFDLLGNPCVGDTVAFAVLHINGFLSGSEIILWLKNDTLLPSMTGEDTLLITSSGKYECKVFNPNSNCPFDSTNYVIEYNCSGVNIDEIKQELLWTIFPNPAGETISIQFKKHHIQETIQIYNSIGSLLKSVIPTSSTTNINISDFPKGLYHIRLENNLQPALKFIKL
jgi:hypothetical protein